MPFSDMRYTIVPEHMWIIKSLLSQLITSVKAKCGSLGVKLAVLSNNTTKVVYCPLHLINYLRDGASLCKSHFFCHYQKNQYHCYKNNISYAFFSLSRTIRIFGMKHISVFTHHKSLYWRSFEILMHYDACVCIRTYRSTQKK